MFSVKLINFSCFKAFYDEENGGEEAQTEKEEHREN
jgi:hypothetical protein